MAKQNHKEIMKETLAGFLTEKDPILSMLEWTAEQMMLIEAEKKVGASKGQHSPDRATHFSGKRVRRFDTRLGTIYLYIPKLRNGGYVPFFVTEKKRSEQALISLVQEAFVNGVSTRKMERLARSLGVDGISASQVSEINKGLKTQVEEFRNRPLEAEYPFIWVDALYEKIRSNGKVINHAIMIAYAVNLSGKREILAIEPMYEESAESWQLFFDKLKQRGLKNVWMLISDAHAGIQKSFRRSFLGANWQRCKVHFMRNILARVTYRDKNLVSEKLKQIWLQPNKKEALRVAKDFIDDYQNKYPEAIGCLQNGLEDSLQFYEYPEIDKKRISSTNVLERINRDVRRRSRVVGVFPSQESYIRLITSYLIEYSEDWSVDCSYINKVSLVSIKSRKEDLLVT